MSKAGKIILWILIILVLAGTFLFYWGKTAFEKILFSNPRLTGLNLQGITINDLANIALTGQSKTVNVSLEMDVVNNNNFSIPFSKMKVKLLYNNILIAETSPLLQVKRVVPANSSVTISDIININLNNASGQMLIEKLKKRPVTIDYIINVSVFGIPLPSIKNNFSW